VKYLLDSNVLLEVALNTANATNHRLDFDGAFIYTVAELHNLTIISFDQDFDGAPRGRIQPGAATHS
jgi:predicted nucleic acid-binding protein